MRKIGMKRLVAVFALVICIGVPLIVNALICPRCGHEGATMYNTEEYKWNSKEHTRYLGYYISCSCGKHRVVQNVTTRPHDIKTTTTKYPKLNLKVITKSCKQSGCGYKKETYQPIDPKKAWTSPQ